MRILKDLFSLFDDTSGSPDPNTQTIDTRPPEEIEVVEKPKEKNNEEKEDK